MKKKNKRLQNRSHTLDKTRSANPPKKVERLRLYPKTLPPKVGGWGFEKNPPFEKKGGWGVRYNEAPTPNIDTSMLSYSAPIKIGGTLEVSKPKICSDRKARREVLFAKGFAGKGKVKKAQWTEKSLVRCN